MPATRDPLSVWWDDAAVRLLERAYAGRGQWTGVFVAPPSPRHRAAAAALGIFDLEARDRWGETRWVRAFKRSVYWHLKRYGYADRLRLDDPRTAAWPAVALEWQTGARVRLAGQPSRRWPVRVRLHPGGARAAQAGAEAADRWSGTSRQSTMADHDW